MKKIILLLVSVFSLGAIYASSFSKSKIEKLENEFINEVVGTITKNTSEDQFEGLITYFEENGIKLDITKVDYNKKNEITGIKILIKKGEQESRYAMSSNMPIADLELGSRDGNLFIKTKGNITSGKISSIMSEFENATKSFDSLLSEHPFSFTFNSDQLRDLLNGAEIDLDELEEKLFSNRKNNGVNSQNNQTSNLPKYSFVNSPSLDKLIIIDGKETDFETLNELAKADKLAEVDNLKPATAVSIYGKKAKDGAIIATTK